jgi:enamine deaminase RidA (YjgF/YER057c/UK114 family)
MSRVLKIVFGLALTSQVVVAQPAPQPPSAPPAGAAPPGTPDVDISVRRRPSLSPDDMLAQSRDYKMRMNQVAQQIQGLVEAARKQKDVIRLNCVLDKLAQVKANLAIADSAFQSLQEAGARRDEAASVHEYTRITIVNQKVQVLGAEAQACVGEDLSYVGTTRVDVEVEGIPPEDPTQPTPTRPDITRPPSASPFQ